MSIPLRKFNEKGIQIFEDFVETSRQNNSVDRVALDTLIHNNELTEIMDGFDSFDEIISSKKIEVAQYLAEKLNLKDAPKLYYDVGMWAWLSALYFEYLIQKDKHGLLKFSKDNSLYIPMTYPRNRWHRHLLAFATWIYTDLGLKGRIYLRGQIFERGEIVEQLSAAKDIQRNIGVIEAATVLFYDEATDTIKKGAASSGDVGGTSVRFREVLQQFKMTFDLNAMNGMQIVGILPSEFSKWRQAS